MRSSATRSQSTAAHFQWFIANTCEKPKAGKCLFYTRGLSSTAAAYGRSNGFTTIWDMWDKSLYDNSQVKRNPIRCIMASKGEGGPMRKYFANMSKAMAFQCDGFVTVMDKNVNANNKKFSTLIQTGIWYNVEFPQLKTGGFGKKAQQIEAMSPDGKTQFTYWTRANGNAARSLEGSFNETETTNPDDMVLPAEVEQAIDDMVDEMDFDEFFARYDNENEEKHELTKRTKSPLARCVNGRGNPASAKNFNTVSW
ncbi:hypothetical protein P280DRAFT_64461 [Massarina eburnea CBS 473.64]|uniref:Uncharacterized protein n=1 Tax=Massarina eburnea CBS 473.64 TaxID=1395130 RepID=A0A6A6RWQ3_9PLEO|nr:hypothetical protein P280DRAFT_64461 [Massarina eburnea CBS 473.64]